MAKKKKQGPATATLAALVDGEVARALRWLNIPSLEACQRERDLFKGRSPFDVEEYKGVAPAIVVRLVVLDLVEAVALDTVLDTLDEFIVELRTKLPKAHRRPLTDAEVAEVFASADRDLAAQRVRQEEENARRSKPLNQEEMRRWMEGQARRRAAA